MFFDKTRSILSFSTVLSFSQVHVEMKSIMRTNSPALSLMNGFCMFSIFLALKMEEIEHVRDREGPNSPG